MWDLAGNRAVLTVPAPGHSAPITALAQHARAGLVASGDEAGLILLWKAGDGSLERAILAHAVAVTALVFTPDGKQFASASASGEVSLWDREGTLAWSKRIEPASRITQLIYHPGEKALLAGTLDGRVFSLEVASGNVARVLDGKSGAVHALALSPDGDVLAVGTEGGVKLWQTVDWKPGSGWPTDTPVTAAVFVGARLLATGGQTVQVWDSAEGRPLWGLEVSRGPVQSLAFDEAAGALVVSDQGPTVTVFPLPDLHARLKSLQIGVSLFPSSRWATSSPIPPSPPPGHDAWGQRAREHYKRQEWNPLIWVCTSALTRWPEDAKLWFYLGRASSRRSQEWGLARNAFDKAVELDPRNPDPLLARAELSFRVAGFRLKQEISREAVRKMLEGAHDDYSRAILLGADDPTIRKRRDAIADLLSKP